LTGADYYLDDPRLVLVPIEHLGPTGMDAAMAALLVEHAGWTAASVTLFDAAFALYWTRGTALARRTSTWLAPRRRHVAIVRDPVSVRPYVQLLNTSAWMLYASDVDASLSHPELAGYLLAYGDRLAVSREVTTAAVETAAWWLERTDAECAAFAEAAARSPRPDGDAFRALADALPWLRRLRHETLRPMVVVSPHRPIPGTGLLVPRALEAEPPALVGRWTAVARRTLAEWRAAWRSGDPAAVSELCEWLRDDAPPLLVTGTGNRVLWDADAPDRIGPVRAALRTGDAVAVRAILADLRLVAERTREFHAALVDPAALPAPAPNTDQSGYAYLHLPRGRIAYDVDEPSMERLVGPPLPWARHMLGARVVHEWAHLADRAGWVIRTATRERFAELRRALAAALDATIAAAPSPVRRAAAVDVAALAEAADGSAGRALVRILVSRMPDYRANLIAWRFMRPMERETYLRQNVRTLRLDYDASRFWRMLVRYLYEYQYLGARLGSPTITDPRAFFIESTWLDEDVLRAGVVDDAGFDTLAAAVAELCASYAIDETKFV
jgi:hypothetical protein